MNKLEILKNLKDDFQKELVKADLDLKYLTRKQMIKWNDKRDKSISANKNLKKTVEEYLELIDEFIKEETK